jgi:hypothetical protein
MKKRPKSRLARLVAKSDNHYGILCHLRDRVGGRETPQTGEDTRGTSCIRRKERARGFALPVLQREVRLRTPRLRIRNGASAVRSDEIFPLVILLVLRASPIRSEQDAYINGYGNKNGH